MIILLNIYYFRIYLVSKLIEYLTFSRQIEKKLKNFDLDLVIDVGANLGQTINIIKRVNPKCKVIAFEPNKELYQVLVKKFSNNLVVKIENLGVSSESGQLAFHENIFHATSTF
ncbi:FkbM family methyltransferase [Vibrio coralliilyticus]|uniref:FkbM family methyltransferase n=1 Tax=Vibrio coralliilyticus TaxID=190893 RepID=UPI0007DC0F58